MADAERAARELGGVEPQAEGARGGRPRTFADLRLQRLIQDRGRRRAEPGRGVLEREPAHGHAQDDDARQDPIPAGELEPKGGAASKDHKCGEDGQALARAPLKNGFTNRSL